MSTIANLQISRELETVPIIDNYDNQNSEQVSSKKSCCTQKSKFIFSILGGGLFLGTITALVIGILFGPLAGLLGFLCGALVGASLTFAFTFICRNDAVLHNAHNEKSNDNLQAEEPSTLDSLNQKILKNLKKTSEILDSLKSKIGK